MTNVDMQLAIRREQLTVKDRFKWNFHKLKGANRYQYVDYGYMPEYDEDDIRSRKSDFIKIKTKNPSSSGYATVFINKKDCQKIIGVTIDKKSLKKRINTLFWGAPIYCCVVVDSEDYFIDEYIKDIYTYDKDEIYNICEKLFKNHKEREYILGYIKGNLPEYPTED